MRVLPPGQRWETSLPSLAPGSMAPVGKRLADHVAGLAGGDGVFAVEGQRRLLGEAGALPLVVEGDGAEPLVVVERAGMAALWQAAQNSAVL